MFLCWDGPTLSGPVQMGDDCRRADALIEFGSLLAWIEQRKRAVEVWTEAEQVIGALENPRRESDVMSKLSITLARAQQWTQAEKAAHRVKKRSSSAADQQNYCAEAGIRNNFL
jgi:hypothetical protein